MLGQPQVGAMNNAVPTRRMASHQHQVCTEAVDLDSTAQTSCNRQRSMVLGGLEAPTWGNSCSFLQARRLCRSTLVNGGALGAFALHGPGDSGLLPGGCGLRCLPSPKLAGGVAMSELPEAASWGMAA